MRKLTAQVQATKTLEVASVLGTRLVHKRNCELTRPAGSMHARSRLAQSLPIVVGKAYEYHIGKALHSAANL